MAELTWEEPPNKLLTRGSTDWLGVAKALKARPNEWAVVAENVSASTGTHIRYGKLKAFEPSGAFEARVSGTKVSGGGRASKVYARYVVGSAPTTPVESEMEVESPFSDWTEMKD